MKGSGFRSAVCRVSAASMCQLVLVCTELKQDSKSDME